MSAIEALQKERDRLRAERDRMRAERDEAQQWLVRFAREIAGLLGVSVTPIDLDAIREALERAIASWKREEADWHDESQRLRARERELLEALRETAPRRSERTGGWGCALCGKTLAPIGTGGELWEQFEGHAPDCIVKPAEEDDRG